ncbi:MAG TPA: Jag N-terminal domain-containing protein [Spirochaetota bacterium]|nr:Jag N-terminal domain-containing protein [Spirochaetota bacterium]HOM38824.1 Jag N-terminal domain-containing protein [Spirochaetota bacterium]HPQ49882.1 Jag N-terminal domain-containing protein [Spirochaetota bacterium]
MIEKVIEVEGKTLDEAINNGLELINKKREEVDIEVIRDPSSTKLFGFALKAKVKIRYTENDISNVSNRAIEGKKFIENILRELDINASIISIKESDDVLSFEIDSDSDELTANNGEILESIQALTYIIINKNEEKWKKLIIDINEYRKKREAQILSEVKKAIEKVKKTGKPYWIGPYAAYERKMIHMFVDKENGVTTESEGKGLYKKVWIKPK